MTGIPFDTLSTARRLREKGLPQEQAEAIADELRISSYVDFGHLATKEDIADFATKSDLAELRSATKSDLAELKADLLKWYIGVAMFQIAGIIAVAKIMHP